MNKWIINNSQLNSCGYDAMEYLLKRKLTLDDFERLTKTRQSFSLEDLVIVAKYLKINFAVASFNNLRIIKQQPNPFFAVILHSTAVNEHVEHWYPGQIKYKTRPNIYLCADETGDMIMRKHLLSINSHTIKSALQNKVQPELNAMIESIQARELN